MALRPTQPTWLVACALRLLKSSCAGVLKNCTTRSMAEAAGAGNGGWEQSRFTLACASRGWAGQKAQGAGCTRVAGAATREMQPIPQSTAAATDLSSRHSWE